MDFQKKLKDIFGREPKGDALKSFIISLVDRENSVTGFKETQIRDSRYGALKNFAMEHLPEDPDIEVLILCQTALKIIFFLRLKSIILL